MKIPSLVLIGAVVLGTAAVRADDYTCKEPFSQSHAFSPTGTLRLENIDGRIEIRAWNRDEILIEGEKSAPTEDELRQIDLEIKTSDDDATIKVHLPKRHGGWFDGDSFHGRVTFRISVPATAHLAHVACVNSGIQIDGVRGPMTIQSVNGGITARGLAANAHLNTVNGQISAAFDQIIAGQELNLATVNGGVTVKVPKDAGLSVHCSVLNGGIECALPITTAHQSRHRLSGTIGDGRASLHADSVNGGIHVETL